MHFCPCFSQKDLGGCLVLLPFVNGFQAGNPRWKPGSRCGLNTTEKRGSDQPHSCSGNLILSNTRKPALVFQLCQFVNSWYLVFKLKPVFSHYIIYSVSDQKQCFKGKHTLTHNDFSNRKIHPGIPSLLTSSLTLMSHLTF